MPVPAGAATPSTAGAAGATGDIDPAKDEQKLLQQARDRADQRALNLDPTGAAPASIFSEDWWSHTRPVLELHGYFRTRGELFHNFSLGRRNDPDDPQALWKQPLDNTYVNQDGNPRAVVLCTDSAGTYQACGDKSQAFANMRFRLNPELHISDNLRVMAQIDALDNVILGSTPDSYALTPSKTGGYGSAGYNGYAANSLFSSSQTAPTAGVNGYRNSIDVKRAWAEYLTPVGLLRFGRMPNHWGLGMVLNSGDGIDQDYQTNTDRIMFVSGIRSADLYFGGSWNFAATGPTSSTAYDIAGGQPYNTANRTNVGEWFLFVARRMNPEMQRLSLARGDVVINAGAFGLLKTQELDVAAGQAPQALNATLPNNGLERRGATLITPDAWVQLLWKKFRIESEVAFTLGSIDVTPQNANPANPIPVRMGAFTTEADFRAIDDKLHIGFGSGWASGDSWLSSLNPGDKPLAHGRDAMSMFRMNPAYNVDLIFFRRIMSRVQGAYFFRPSVSYDFIRNPNGQKLGGGAAIIWSRATEFVQTPGHKRDLGVELDLNIYYQAKDGSLNDDPTRQGGFYAMMQYGVFFPLGGLDYAPQPRQAGLTYDISTAQTVRLHLGVVF